MSSAKKKFLKNVFIALIVPIVIYLGLVFYVGGKVYEDNKVISDGIIVLGAKAYKGEQYNPCLVSRVSHAVELYREKYAAKIIVSGGVDQEDQQSESETMRKIAIELGVSESDITRENQATSTYENMTYSKQIMDSQNMHSAIIVTEGFHNARAGLVAQKVGIPFTLSPATDSSCWSRWKYLSRYFLKEPFALIYYKFKDRI